MINVKAFILKQIQTKFINFTKFISFTKRHNFTQETHFNFKTTNHFYVIIAYLLHFYHLVVLS